MVLDVGFCTKRGEAGLSIRVMPADDVEQKHSSSTAAAVLYDSSVAGGTFTVTPSLLF